MAQSSPTPKYSYLNLLDEGTLIEWFSNYGKYLLYGIGALVFALIVLFTVSRTRNAKAESDYLQAANDFAYITKSSTIKDQVLMDKTIEQFNGLVAKHPELHAAYDGDFAQTLLNRGQILQALPIAERTLNRIASTGLLLYQDYARNSLLISQEKFQEALDKTLLLQQMMIDKIHENQSLQEREFSDELFAFNLLRIAMLQQQLGDNAGELLTWKQWRQYAGLEKGIGTEINIHPKAFQIIIQQLAAGSFALPDYINYRLNNLIEKKITY